MNFFSPPELGGVPPSKPPCFPGGQGPGGAQGGSGRPCPPSGESGRAFGPVGKQGGFRGGTPPNSGGEKKFIDPPPSMNFFLGILKISEIHYWGRGVGYRRRY